MAAEDEKSTSSNSGVISTAQDDERDQEKSDDISLPAHVPGSGSLDRLVDTARYYARAAASDNTLKAYAKDWAHFARWCRMKGAEPLPPSPEMIGLYLADLASGSGPSPAAGRAPRPGRQGAGALGHRRGPAQPVIAFMGAVVSSGATESARNRRRN